MRTSSSQRIKVNITSRFHTASNIAPLTLITDELEVRKTCPKTRAISLDYNGRGDVTHGGAKWKSSAFWEGRASHPGDVTHGGAKWKLKPV